MAMRKRIEPNGVKSARMTVNMTPESYATLKAEADKVSLPLGQYIVSEALRSVEAHRREEQQREAIKQQEAIVRAQSVNTAEMGQMLKTALAMLPEVAKLKVIAEAEQEPGKAGKARAKRKAPQKGRKHG